MAKVHLRNFTKCRECVGVVKLDLTIPNHLCRLFDVKTKERIWGA